MLYPIELGVRLTDLPIVGIRFSFGRGIDAWRASKFGPAAEFDRLRRNAVRVFGAGDSN
jgi:hypothetical protein